MAETEDRRIERPLPGWHLHDMRVTSSEELDEELLGWLRESYRQMGLQQRLARRREEPLRG